MVNKTEDKKDLNESMLKLSEKMAEISRGDAGSEAYKEFCTLWMDTNKEIYGKCAMSMQPTGEMFEHFVKKSDIFLTMYKSWIAALETMSEKAQEMSKQYPDPEGFKEFFNIWITTSEKAFNDFFEDMPTPGGPIKEIMEPVKAMTKMYADTFTRMSKMCLKSRSASAYPGKFTT